MFLVVLLDPWKVNSYDTNSSKPKEQLKRERERERERERVQTKPWDDYSCFMVTAGESDTR